MSSFSENMLQDHGEAISPSVALGLSVTLLVLSLGSFMWVLKKHKDQGKKCSCSVSAVLTFVVPLVCFVSGGIFLLYSTSLKERNEQDYHGLMRVTDVNFLERTETKRERDDGATKRSYVHVYEAVFNVDWGYEWACPDHGAPTCLSSFVPCSEEICETLSRLGTCRSTEVKRAVAKVERCAKALLNGTSFDKSLYSPFVATDGPSSDVDWPSVIAFGDCDRCEANYEVASPSSLKTMRLSAAATLVIGLVLAAVLVFLKRKSSSSPDAEKSPSVNPPSSSESESDIVLP